MSASLGIGNVIMSREFVNALLLAVRPASAEDHLLVAPKIGLITSDPLSLGPDTTLAELEAIQAAFSGYTAGGQAITLGAIPIRAKFDAVALAGNVAWVGSETDPFVSASIGGWYLHDTTYGLVCACQFAQPVLIASPGDYLDLFVGLPVKLYV